MPDTVCTRCGATGRSIIIDTRRKAVACKDGTTMSVQVGHNLYCTPRQDEGPWTNVEVGFISDKDGNPLTPPDEWKEYSDGDFPSDVYGYVPVELVEQLIAEHGGRKEWV